MLADRGFYNERVIRRTREIAGTVVPVTKQDDRLKDELDVHCSYMTPYWMYKGHEREIGFLLAVSVSYQAGDRGTSGEVVRGYVACDLADPTPNRSSGSITSGQRSRRVTGWCVKPV